MTVRLRVDARVPGVQLDVGELAEPEQRRQVVAEEVLAVPVVVLRTRARTVSTNSGSFAFPVLLVEELRR